MIHTAAPLEAHFLQNYHAHATLHGVMERNKIGHSSSGRIYWQEDPHLTVWAWNEDQEWSTAIANPCLPEAVRLSLIGRTIWDVVQIESLRLHPWARSVITEITQSTRGDGIMRRFIHINSALPE